MVHIRPTMPTRSIEDPLYLQGSYNTNLVTFLFNSQRVCCCGGPQYLQGPYKASLVTFLVLVYFLFHCHLILLIKQGPIVLWRPFTHIIVSIINQLSITQCTGPIDPKTPLSTTTTKSAGFCCFSVHR